MYNEAAANANDNCKKSVAQIVKWFQFKSIVTKELSDQFLLKEKIMNFMVNTHCNRHRMYKSTFLSSTEELQCSILCRYVSQKNVENLQAKEFYCNGGKKVVSIYE